VRDHAERGENEDEEEQRRGDAVRIDLEMGRSGGHLASPFCSVVLQLGPLRVPPASTPRPLSPPDGRRRGATTNASKSGWTD